MAEIVWSKSDSRLLANNTFEGRICEVETDTERKTLVGFVYGSTKEECEKRANLIVAAPAMLEALKMLRELRHQWRHDDQFTSIDYMDAIDGLPWEAAIAKAEGK